MSKAGKIYFVRRQTGLVKIGFTTSLKARLESLTRSHGPLEVLRVVNGDVARERGFHSRFARFNEYGEWFRPDPSLLEEIAQIEDGDAVSVAGTDTKRRWLQGEREMVAITKDRAERLLLARQQRTGMTEANCLKAICADYGITPYFIARLKAGRTATVSAYAFKAVHDALVRELEARLEQLKLEMAAVERGEVLPERDFVPKYAKKKALRA